jgi:hypothetical protein
MTVEVLYVDGCPHCEAVILRLQAILAESHSTTRIEARRITDERSAVAERFLGSPTVRVNGRDVEPGAEHRRDFGLKCRLYRTPTGLSGEPQDGLLLAALTAVSSPMRSHGSR